LGSSALGYQHRQAQQAAPHFNSYRQDSMPAQAPPGPTAYAPAGAFTAGPAAAAAGGMYVEGLTQERDDGWTVDGSSRPQRRAGGQQRRQAAAAAEGVRGGGEGGRGRGGVSKKKGGSKAKGRGGSSKSKGGPEPVIDDVFGGGMDY
jgi:hypothetical protein